MPANCDITLRELDQRTADGIDVRLLWDARTSQIFIAVEDHRGGGSQTFEVDGRDALAAFHHPYAYAEWPRRAPTQTHQPEARRR
jgi:hypothetical protein